MYKVNTIAHLATPHTDKQHLSTPETPEHPFVCVTVLRQSPLTHITAFSAHKSLHAYPTYNDTSDAKRLTSVALARTLH